MPSNMYLNQAKSRKRQQLKSFYNFGFLIPTLTRAGNFLFSFSFPRIGWLDVMFYLHPTSHEMSQKKDTRTDIIMPTHGTKGHPI